MKTFFWIMTIFGCLLGGLITVGGALLSTGAPQQGAAAAIGVACAVIPYCFARAISEISGKDN